MFISIELRPEDMVDHIDEGDCRCEYHKFVRDSPLSILVHPDEPIPVIKHKIATHKQLPWSRINLFSETTQLLNNKTLNSYNIQNGDTLRADLVDRQKSVNREQLIQIGETQYLQHPEFRMDVTVRDIKKWLCDEFKNEELYDQIEFQNPYGMNDLLAKEDTEVWQLRREDTSFVMAITTDMMSVPGMQKDRVKILWVKMKGTNKWLIEDKLDKLCDGYCRGWEHELMMTIPVYLKQIVRGYHPNVCKYDQYALFHRITYELTRRSFC